MSREFATPARRVLSRAAVEELSARRQEPDWLRDIRLRAFDAFERLPLPDQRTEGWRRTSLRGLPLENFDPLANVATRSIVPDDALAQHAGASFFAYRNGMALREDGLEAGWVMDLRDALQEPTLAQRIEQHFGRIVLPETDKFTALHYAFFNAGVVAFIPRNTPIEEPVWVSYDFDESHPALVHTLIIAEEGADVRFVEDFRNAAGIASGVTEQWLGPNAHARYVHLQRFGPEVWNFSTQRAYLSQDASLRTLNVAAGAKLSRNSVQVLLDGARSQADLLGIVETGDRQHVDFQTLQDHCGSETRSDLVIHDALRDRSSANFTGLIRINPSSRQTESSQEQKNILLSDQAKADSDPKLEILNNDVIRCTHGASVGPVDQESIFYLQSRGIDRPAAERLLVEGFFRSVLDKMQMPSVEAAVWQAIGYAEGTAE